MGEHVPPHHLRASPLGEEVAKLAEGFAYRLWVKWLPQSGALRGRRLRPRRGGRRVSAWRIVSARPIAAQGARPPQRF